MPNEKVPHVVVVGGGFGGLSVARSLKRAPVRVTLVDRTNHNLFQPLLYQVATAMLAPGDIATSIRQALRKQPNATVALAEVTGVKTDTQCVLVDYLGEPDTPFHYDYLILALGATHSYFGRNEFAPFAPGLKSLPDATSIRAKVLTAFEVAEIERDPSKHTDLLTFVIVGGGPTGVEMAGALAELRRFTLKSDFRRIDPSKARIILAEGSPRLLAAFPEELSHKAQKRLEKLGVEVHVGKHVEQIDDSHVVLGGEQIPCRTVIWAAGVQPSPAGKWLNTPTDKAGRVRINEDCSVPGLPNVFVIGDTASLDQDGKPLPGVAQVAMQQGAYVARLIRNRVTGRPAPKPFRYFNKGNMAVIGKGYAVMEMGKIHLSGLPAWFTWAMIHIMFLPAGGNRVRVAAQWMWTFLNGQRSSQLILKPRLEPAPAPAIAELSGGKGTADAPISTQSKAGDQK